MAVNDEYDIEVELTYRIKVTAQHETEMTDRGLDPTDPNDVRQYFREVHLDRPENLIYSTMMLRKDDPVTWPQGDLLVGAEISVNGPI